jgi:ankyrin repeat protein
LLSHVILHLQINNDADEKGLRMTPLAWHTHAGNASIVKLLLQNGAEVNADFDAQHDPNQKVTAMDLARSLIGNKATSTSSEMGNNDVNDKFVQTFLALKQFGGLTYDEILAQDGDSSVEL